MRVACLAILLCIGVSVPASYAEPLRLVYPNFVPYTFASEQPLAGGNFLIDKIMQELNVSYQSKMVPNYKRALSDVENGMADGFFLASQNQQRDQVAVFSHPILFNNWSWFFRYDSYLDPDAEGFKSSAKVSSIEGTNTLRWLNKHYYRVIGKQKNVAKLAQLLFDLKRIDAAFLSADVFKTANVHTNIISGEYIEVVQRSAPFGIYISKNYLAKHPDFMLRLNLAISKVQKHYLDNSYTLSGIKRQP